MKTRRILCTALTIVLCVAIALSVILPLLMGPAPAASEVYTIRIEAEDAYWNGYQAVKTSGTSPNPTVVGNMASTHTYATWDELAALKLNKNIHTYVAFCIDVPHGGIYQISTGNVIRMKSSGNPYAAIVVNPQYNGQAYKLNYGSVGTDAKYCISEKVNVQLQKGRNIIYMVPFTADQNINWSDADFIEVTGAYAVTHVAPTAPVSVAANAGGHYKFSTVSSDALAGATVTNAQGMTAASITREHLGNVPHVSYTVEAPADGYYEISLKFSCSGNASTSNYGVALLVDNRPAETKPIYGTSDSSADISTYLTKGVHVLTIPVILPKTDSSKTVYWSDLKGLTLYGGLTLSDQFNNLQIGTLLEAETYASTWRYTTVSENNGRLMVGGSQPGLNKQTYDQLVSGEKLDKNQPMLTYMVDVLTAGDYTLNVSYRNYAQAGYYMIVAIDDQTYVKAVYSGDDPNFTGRQLATSTLSLTPGRHVIRLITLPGDVSATWIDVDYVAFKGPNPVIGYKDWVHLQSGDATVKNGFTGTTTIYSSYGQWWNNALTGYQGNSMASAAGVTTGNFTHENLFQLGWFRYAIHVPKDGYYDMQTYLQPDADSYGTGKILLGIEKTDVNLINQAQGVIGLNYTGDSSGWLDIAGEYKSLCVTAKNYLPMDQSAEAYGNVGYSMVLRVTLDNGQSYAFRIINDPSGRYGYSRYGANGSVSGWDGWVWIDESTADLINGAGAQFQVERTNANTLTLTLGGKVLDSYTIAGVTADNKVVSVGFRQYGNPKSNDYRVEVPYSVTYVQPPVIIDMPGIENGTVTTEKENYKVGDTVVLNVSPIPGYSQKLTINGQPILLDWETGTYSFTASDTSYDIDGRFEEILWNNTTYRWVDVRLDKGAQRWWIADLSSYLTEGDYFITVSGLMDYTGDSDNRCDMGALTVSGGITCPDQPGEDTPKGVVTNTDLPSDVFYRNDNVTNLPDPFVLDNTARDGYYYIYGTWGAFSCYRSKNLMDWEYCSDVLQQYRENNKVWDSAQNKYSYQLLANDLWAPEVIYDPDTQLYYLFFSTTPDLKNQATASKAYAVLMVATSTSPTGPFDLVNFKDANSCGAGNVHTYSTGTYSDYFAPYLFLDPAKNKEFSLRVNNNEWRGQNSGGYIANIDPHPYVAPDGKKYLFWVDTYGADRICAVEMENWLKPKWETATALIYADYYTVDDWKNGSKNTVDYEYDTTTNEGPFVIEHNGKYYLTLSVNNWKRGSYMVIQAVSDSVLGPYTKLTAAEGGILLSGTHQGSQTSGGTGHHSLLNVGDQLYIIYHRQNEPYVYESRRNHAIDEVKWITVNGFVSDLPKPNVIRLLNPV